MSPRRPHVVPIAAPSFPTMPRPPIYRRIAYTFIALTVLIVIAVLWLSSVRAEVVVKAKKNAVKTESMVEVAKTPASGQIIGRVAQGTFEKIQEFEVPEPGAVSSSASVIPPSEPAGPAEKIVAKGTVKIVNTYSKPQTLVQKTRLWTPDKKQYRIAQTIVVPAGGTITVTAYADGPGEEYLISGPMRFTIPGLFIDLQKLIYAESSEPFKAVPYAESPFKDGADGSAKPSSSSSSAKPPSGKAVTQAVLDDAYKTLTDTILEQAKRSLQGEVSDEKFSDAVYFVKLVEKKSTPTAGQSADRFLASVKLDVTAVFYPKEDMQALVRSKLKEKIPEGREFLPFDDQSITFTLESADTKTETAVVRVNAEGAYRLTAQSPLLQKAVIAGKTKDEAVQLLKSFSNDIEDVKVTIKPTWLRKIPSLKDHIEIKVE